MQSHWAFEFGYRLQCRRGICHSPPASTVSQPLTKAVTASLPSKSIGQRVLEWKRPIILKNGKTADAAADPASWQSGSGNDDPSTSPQRFSWDSSIGYPLFKVPDHHPEISNYVFPTGIHRLHRLL